MMTISNLDFLHYMTAVSHEMSDEPEFFHSSEEREISSEELVDFLRAIWDFAPRN